MPWAAKSNIVPYSVQQLYGNNLSAEIALTRGGVYPIGESPTAGLSSREAAHGRKPGITSSFSTPGIKGPLSSPIREGRGVDPRTQIKSPSRHGPRQRRFAKGKNPNLNRRNSRHRGGCRLGCRFGVRTMTEAEQDEQFYRDTESVAHAKLDERQVAMLEGLGSRRDRRAGRSDLQSGTARYSSDCRFAWGVGRLRGARGGGADPWHGGSGANSSARSVHSPGQRRWQADARKAEESEILEVPGVRFRQTLAELPGVSE